MGKKSTLEFDANDFDVPLQRPTRSKKVAFNPRISRSDWDIYHRRTGSEMREELEMLLSRNSKELSIRSKSPEYEDFKSQYFDALETLSEDEEEVPSKHPHEVQNYQNKIAISNDDDDEYEDIEEETEDLKPRIQKRNHIDIRSQPTSVQKRVKAMKKLLYQQKQIESEMFKDIHKLEGYFYKMHQNKFYNERLKQVEGELNQSTIIEEDENEEDVPKEDFQQQGIPGFWLRVLLNSKNLSQIVQAADGPLLNNLVDVRVFNFENPLGFRIAFTFKPNEYFIDTELTKDYFLKVTPSEEDDPLTFEGPEVVGCQGCKIAWKRHQNLTIRPLKRVQNHKIVTKWARKNSFFNFFNPPKLGDVDEVHHLRRRELLEAHFEIGLFFKEQVIPKAYLFFTQNGYDGHVSKTLSVKRAKLRTPSKANTPARVPRRRGSVEGILDKKQKETATQEVEVVLRRQDSNENIIVADNNNEVVQPDKEQKTLQSQVMAQDDPTEIVDSISLPEKDPFPGRYLMESSDKFDDFMKALGVGMIKRKLANSVVPINEVEIMEDGLYVIRTLTTVRNTEISFRLNEMFLEDTIDGRTTQTTPTRVGKFS